MNLAYQSLPAVRALLENFLDGAIELLAVLRRQLFCGNHNHGNRSPIVVLTNLVQKLEAVHFGHHQVQHHQVGLPLAATWCVSSMAAPASV